MAERSFLILHGYGYDGDPAHWHAWLERTLHDRGERVSRPLMPDPDSPALARWKRIARGELTAMGDERIAGAEHLNPDDGYGEWPSLLAWCEDPRVRIEQNR